MERRTVAHQVATALAEMAFDDTHMADEIGGIIQDYQDGEIDEATMETRIMQSLDDGNFAGSVIKKVLHRLVQAGKEY